MNKHNEPGTNKDGFHETDDQLELYAMDRLSQTAVIRVEEHLMVCEVCRDRLESNAAFAFAVQAALKQNPEFARQKTAGWREWLDFSQWQPRFAVAAFAAVMLMAGIYWSGSGGISGKVPPVASLQLLAMRGEMQTVPEARELNVILSDAPAGTPPYRLEVVDSAGGAVWAGSPTVTATGLTVHIAKPFPAGAWFARLYDSSGRLLHEYGFRTVGP